MSLLAIAEFLAKSGMRKIGSGIYMFTALIALRSQNLIETSAFVELSQWLIIALFGGNSIEHFLKTKASLGNQAAAPVQVQTPLP